MACPRQNLVSARIFTPKRSSCPALYRASTSLLPVTEGADGRDKPGHDDVPFVQPFFPSNQILLGDDFAEPRIVRDELLDELVHAVLEDVVHVGVLEPVADAAGVALGRTLAAIGNADLVEIAHQIAVAARERARQRVVE